MKKNQILYISRLLCRLILGLILVSGVSFVGVILVSIVAPERLPFEVILQDSFTAGWGNGNMRFCQACAVEGDLLLTDLSIWLKGWLLFRGAIFITIGFLIVYKIGQILETDAAFYHSNVKHFQQLALIAFGAFLLSSFNFGWLNETPQFQFTIAWGILAFALGARLL
ncbi:MAG: hypothetical protein AAFQ87_07775, partial [Bacteroidota bacterium]